MHPRSIKECGVTERNIMNLIQRYEHQTHPMERHMDSVSRFLDGDYMGSSEFEYGAVPKSWKYLRENVLVLREMVIPIQGKNTQGETTLDAKKVWVIGNEAMMGKVAIDLKDKVFNRDYHGFKENPRLVDRFFHKEGDPISLSFYEKIVGWLCIDAAYNAHSGDIQHENSPVFFCLDKTLAVRTFLELNRKKIVKKEINILDHVYCYFCPVPVKVAAILEDNSIVVKSFNKKFRLHPNDVFHKDEVPTGIFM